MATVFHACVKSFTLGLCIVTLYFLRGVHCDYERHNSHKNELPDCSSEPSFAVFGKVTEASFSKQISSKHRELLLVSTLDGRLSALDPTHDGKLIWSHNTGHGELLSSTISKLEIPDKGQWVRLIPSLDGNLYKFDGSSLEPVPFSAETLLKSSFKLGDDTIITGGTDIRNYGICLQTGKLRYMCSVKDCSIVGDPVSYTEDILIVRRMTRTVRGVEPRTGIEKWNFSVGEHQVTFMEGIDDGCKNTLVIDDQLLGNTDAFVTCDFESCNADRDNVEIMVSMPDGLISLYDRFSDKKWSHKLESPVVNVWHLKNGKLNVVDLFNQNIVFDCHESNHFEHKTPEGSPLLYVGIHEKQPYIKHSPLMKIEITNSLRHYVLSPDYLLPRLAWKPYLVSAPSRTPVINMGRKDVSESSPILLNEVSTALTLKNEFDYPYDSGYYLYDFSRHLAQLNSTLCSADEEKEEETLEQIIIVSLWYWWKEVLAISIVTSIAVNLLITRHIMRRMRRHLIQESNSSPEIKEFQVSVLNCSQTPISEVEETVDSKDPEFVSRYLTDFEPIQCLGKGGFGVVFESRNKLDDCSYAVKRICLPNRKEAREKVMREVKALAKLDHNGIVRYFNAWLECPPPGWQELKDKHWDDSFKTSSTPYCSTTVSLNPDSQAKQKSFNPLKPFRIISEKSNFRFERVSDSEDKNSLNLENQLSISNDLNCLASSGSFEVVFNANLEGEDVWTNLDNDSNKTNHPESSSSSTEKLPFRRYHNNVSACTSKSHDSQYADNSESNDNLQENFKERNMFSNLEKHTPIFGHLTRPSTLKINNTKPDLEMSAKIYLYIQMQLCRKESLKEWLNTNSYERNREEVLDIFDQIVCAVQYVHECGLMHRDLKPSNIFFSLDGTVKIGDFGLVTAMSENEAYTPSVEQLIQDKKYGTNHTDQVGTQLYMSLEQIVGNGYNHKVDIFSLGIIFFELLNPFPTQMERIKILLNVKNQKYPESFQQKYPDECRLITQLLSPDPEKRPSASDIRAHPFFKEFQPQPTALARVCRRRTISQRMSSSSSDCESVTIDSSCSLPSVSR